MTRSSLILAAAALLVWPVLLLGQKEKEPERVCLTEPCKYGDEEVHPVSVRSPDGRKTITVRPARDGTDSPVVSITSNGQPVRHDVRYMTRASLLWSPASNAFLIDSTDADTYDGWVLRVFVFRGPRIEEVDVAAEARKDLERVFPMCVRENPQPGACNADSWRHVNTYGLKWLSGTRLLIEAQIPCSTSYGPNWCKMKAYEVEVPSGRILAAYTQAEAHRVFPKLVAEEQQR